MVISASLSSHPSHSTHGAHPSLSHLHSNWLELTDCKVGVGVGERECVCGGGGREDGGELALDNESMPHACSKIWLHNLINSSSLLLMKWMNEWMWVPSNADRKLNPKLVSWGNSVFIKSSSSLLFFLWFTSILPFLSPLFSPLLPLTLTLDSL